MRADRLLSILMILQTRGKTTADQLADDLEVSVRTIYRDLDALSQAGIPVYAERGPGGGCALLDGYRSDLTGLNNDEQAALLMMGVPEPLAQLGLDQAFKRALLKLSASQPAAKNLPSTWVHLDSDTWGSSPAPGPLLPAIRQAICEQRKLFILRRLEFGTQSPWTVEPLGLVSGAGGWHLVCLWEGQFRVLRLAQIIEARVEEEIFQRPAGFDLAEFWHRWRAEVERLRPTYSVTVRVSPAMMPYFSPHFRDVIAGPAAKQGFKRSDGWFEVSLCFDSLQTARTRLMGFGAGIEVLDPPVLRTSIIDFAEQLLKLYHVPEQ